MTAPDPRVDEIEARLGAARERVATAEEKRERSRRAPDPIFNAGMVLAIQASSMDVPPLIADVAYLLAELRKAHGALARVQRVTDEISAHSQGRALDYTDDDFDRGWHGANRSAVATLRAAVTAANGDGQ